MNKDVIVVTGKALPSIGRADDDRRYGDSRSGVRAWEGESLGGVRGGGFLQMMVRELFSDLPPTLQVSQCARDLKRWLSLSIVIGKDSLLGDDSWADICKFCVAGGERIQ